MLPQLESRSHRDKKAEEYSEPCQQKQPPEMFCKVGVLRIFAKIHRKTPVSETLCNFIKKESLAQVFSCEICEISKNTFFLEHLRTTASVSYMEDGSIC